MMLKLIGHTKDYHEKRCWKILKFLLSLFIFSSICLTGKIKMIEVLLHNVYLLTT